MVRRRRWRAVLIAFVTLVALGGIVGHLYERAAERAALPAPGALFDVEGHRMHIRCVGTGSPPVVLDASGPAWSSSWDGILPRLAQLTRTCAYDRAGLGWSDRATAPRTVDRLSSELQALLDMAGVERPRVLVGASTGGFVVQHLARVRPEEVAGLVLVDAPDETVFARIPEPWPIAETMARRAAWAARFGLLRLVDPLGISKLPLDRAAVLRPLLYRPTAWAAFADMLADRERSARELAQLPPIPRRLPLIVLTHGIPRGIYGPGLDEISMRTEPAWQAMERSIAARSDRGALIIATGSDHLIASRDPDRVVDAVTEVVREARGDAP